MNLDLLFTATPHEEGAWLTLKDALGDDTGVRVKLMGYHAKAWREVRQMYDAQQHIYGQLLSKESDSAEEFKRGMMTLDDLMAKAFLDWENMPDPAGGGLLEFSPKNAALICRLSPVIVKQCDKFFSDAANFIRPSAQKSGNTPNGPSTHTEKTKAE